MTTLTIRRRPSRASVPAEMTNTSPIVVARVRRLTAVSGVALGVVWALAVTAGASRTIGLALLAGWFAMPVVLWASLEAPRLRYLLVVPACLVGAGVTSLALTAGGGVVERAGWVALAAGMWMGGILGTWFWFRLAPVPAALDRPAAPARLALIRMHVWFISAGLALLILPRAADFVAHLLIPTRLPT